jgi:sugar phosphate isomerase/epimerase
MASRNPPNPDLLSINAITLRERALRETVDALRRHRIGGISPWRDKVAQAGLKDAAKMIRDAGLTVTGYCRAGMFPALDRKARKQALDENYRAIEEAATLEAQCLIIVAGGLLQGSKDLIGAREMVRDGLGEILDHARGCGVKLAVEPLHPMTCADRGCVNTLDHALDLCDELDSGKSGALGVAVDVYHVWWDPRLKAAIERAGDQRLHAFHICDWLVPTTDLVFDRGMMGDGVIDIPQIRAWMEANGYRGFHEVEIFSAKNWWKRDADEVLTTCKLRHESVC